MHQDDGSAMDSSWQQEAKQRATKTVGFTFCNPTVFVLVMHLV